MVRKIILFLVIGAALLISASCSLFQNEFISINEGVDNDSLVFESMGDASWSGVRLRSAMDGDAIKSPVISDGQYAEVYTIANISRITFKWKVSSEPDYDGMVFAINGTVVAVLTGEIDWRTESYDLQPGTYLLEWVYLKDGSVSQGDDCGWVDSVYVDMVSIGSATNTTIVKRGEWLFSNNANDTSGNNNHAILSGNTYLTNDRFGNADSAYYFDGNGDYMTLNSIGNNPSGSIEAWIKPDKNTDLYDQIFSQTENFQLTLSSGKIMWRISNNGDGDYLNLQTTWNANVGLWYHIVGTWDGVVSRLYVNGVEVASAFYNSPYTSASSSCYIGRWGLGADHYFNGCIDDLIIYDNALGAQQVYSRYTNTSGMVTEDNVAPTINIIAPSAGSDFAIGQSVNVQGTAYDYFGLQNVYVFNLFQTNTLSTGLSTWNSSLRFNSSGTYFIYAVAVDLSNNISTTNTISVNITNSNTTHLQINTPVSGSRFVKNQTINISGQSSDIYGISEIYVYNQFNTNVLTSSLNNWATSFVISTPGTYTLYAVAKNTLNKYSLTNTISVIVTNSNMAVGLNEAVDNTDVSFTLAGNANWSGYTAEYYFDGDSAISGLITHSQTSEIQTTINPANESWVRFYWKVSSEYNYDKLRFYIDGTEMNNISGTVNWTQKSYLVSAGSHTLTWKYTKDGIVTSGADRGWIDKLEIVEIPDITTNTTIVKRGEWLLDGNINDSSGNNGNGVMLGAPYLTNGRFDTANTAYYFDGVDDCIQLPSIGNNTSGSLEVWFKPAANTANYNQIFSQTENFQVTLQYGKIMWRINDTGGGTYDNYTTTWTVTNGDWYHLVGTWNGTKSRFYINGELSTVFSFTSPIAPTGTYSYLGRWGQGSSYFFKGSIDKFVVYDNPLSPEQVYTLYTNTAP